MIEQIKQALESANMTPWKTDKFGAVVNSNYELVQWYDGNAVVAEKEDAHLIANAPEWLRFLIGEVEKLREQRDRVMKDWHESMNVSEDIIKVVEELGKALEFYASENTYDVDHLSKYGYIIIDKDRGEKARQTLEKVKP